MLYASKDTFLPFTRTVEGVGVASSADTGMQNSPSVTTNASVIDKTLFDTFIPPDLFSPLSITLFLPDCSGNFYYAIFYINSTMIFLQLTGFFVTIAASHSNCRGRCRPRPVCDSSYSMAKTSVTLWFCLVCAGARHGDSSSGVAPCGRSRGTVPMSCSLTLISKKRLFQCSRTVLVSPPL